MFRWLKEIGANTKGVAGYGFDKLIYDGPFSRVYRAHNEDSGKTLAVKALTEKGKQFASRMTERTGIPWEGCLLESFAHPNIVNCIDHSGDKPEWVAMEFLESKLTNHLEPCRHRIHENELIKLASRIVSAVAELHERRFVHRDICLDNILLDGNDEPKLIDFGLTAPTGARLPKDRVGTPSYMAPEMIKNGRASYRGDVYSLGVLLYEIVVGKKLFAGAARTTRMTRSLNVEPIPPSKKGIYCSEEFESLIMRALAKDSSERFDSARILETKLFMLRKSRGLR
ncbi:MAG: serine/threonine protein kinase [Planctomycetes bacterium]|nr:serine/threonine protein kinase [Planctomycetota bacterium]